MPIPYNTTTVSVKRPTVASLDLEPYSGVESDFEIVETGIRATIGTFSRTVSATEKRGGGEQSTTILQLTCDIPELGLTHHDRVLDETTGEEYEVDWVFMRIGLGLDHLTAEIFQWRGLVG